MKRKPIFVSLSLAIWLTIAACAGHVRVYDQWHGDYHGWDNHEEVVYRGYLRDNHRDYHPFASLSVEDHRAYIDWRHAHPEQQRQLSLRETRRMAHGGLDPKGESRPPLNRTH